MTTRRIAGRWLSGTGILLLAACSEAGPTPVASVTVTPVTATVIVGDTLRLAAAVKGASGNVLTDRTVTWASGNSSLATVTTTGLVTGIQASSQGITVTATSENITDTAAITVRPRPPASVMLGEWRHTAALVPPDEPSLNAGLQVTIAIDSVDGSHFWGDVVLWLAGDVAVSRQTFGRVDGQVGDTGAVSFSIPMADGDLAPISVIGVVRGDRLVITESWRGHEPGPFASRGEFRRAGVIEIGVVCTIYADGFRVWDACPSQKHQSDQHAIVKVSLLKQL